MDRITEILNTISGFYAYNDDAAQEYIKLINEAIEEIRALDAEPTSMLENAKNAAITELSNELTNRMSQKTFFNASLERKKTEFRISKALVMVAIGNLVASSKM